MVSSAFKALWKFSNLNHNAPTLWSIKLSPKKIQLHQDTLPPNGSLFLYAQIDKETQVCLTLVVNSIKFELIVTNEGGPPSIMATLI